MSVVSGYAQLSSLFSQYPDLFCIRKFSHLSTELLLYKQAEICHLEAQISVLRKNEPEAFSKSWRSWNLDDSDPIAKEKRSKFSALDEKLRIYQKDLLRLSNLESAARPSWLSLQSVVTWLAQSEGANGFLESAEAEPWKGQEKSDIDDLVCISKQPDTLDRFFVRLIAPLWHKIFRPFVDPVDEEKGLGKDSLWWYSTHHFVRLADVFCVFMSAAIPSASIWALFKVASLTDRLIMITFFTLAFAAVVLLGFGCRRADTFAVTVAFAAVQVVFLDGAGDSLK